MSSLYGRPIYTVGYVGWTPEALQREAQYLNARVLDIRINPTSMRPGWRKQELAALLGSAYHHLPDLGNVNYANGGPINLANPMRAVERVRRWLIQGPVILLCACANWQTCHRREAADFLSEHTGAQVVHLDPPAKQGKAGTMKALTLTQPYASLAAIGAKRIETRSWSTSYRGPLAIHAGVGLGPVGGKRGLTTLCAEPVFFRALEPHCRVVYRNGSDTIDPDDLPLGAVVATCTLVDVVPTGLYRPVTHGDQTWQVPPGNMSQEYSFGDYTPGRFAWLLANVRRLPEPVLVKGALGLWDLDCALLPAGWEV